jgi:voltage-gated potassium channel
MRLFSLMKQFIASLSRMGSELVAIVSAMVGFIIVGTVAYHLMEGWSWISSFYFTVATLTTVGYGDLYPTTELSRLFTAIFALAGVSIAFASFAVIGANYIRKSQELLKGMSASSEEKK